MPTDEQLLTDYYSCNKDALEISDKTDHVSLEGRHRNRMYNSAKYQLAKLGVRGLDTDIMAHEVVGKTMARIVRTKHFPATRWKQERGPVTPWLNTILFRECATAAKERAKDRIFRAANIEDKETKSPVVNERPVNDVGELRAGKLSNCLDKLTPKQRQVIDMKYLDGLQQNVIAELLGIVEGGVANLLNNARQRLRQCLTEGED